MPDADWDPLAPPALNDPVAAMAELRERCPVAWIEPAGGFWAVTRYDDIREATRDSETFINGGGPQWGKARPPLEVERPDGLLLGQSPRLQQARRRHQQ